MVTATRSSRSAANSGEMRKRYEALGGPMQLVVPPGQGHNMWPGFFQCQELVDFVAGPSAADKPGTPSAREPTCKSRTRQLPISTCPEMSPRFPGRVDFQVRCRTE